MLGVLVGWVWSKTHLSWSHCPKCLKGLRRNQYEDWNLTESMLDEGGSNSSILLSGFWCGIRLRANSYWFLQRKKNHKGKDMWLTGGPLRDTEISRYQCQGKMPEDDPLKSDHDWKLTLLYLILNHLGKGNPWTYIMPLKRQWKVLWPYKLCDIIKACQLLTSKWWVFLPFVI